MSLEMEQKPDLEGLKKAVKDAGHKGIRQGLSIEQDAAVRSVRAQRFATGHLAQSIQVKNVVDDGDTISGSMGPEAPYAPFVEYDTRPHIAPMGVFDSWAAVKGFRATGTSFKRGTPKHSALATAGWLAVKIKGTKGIHFMQHAYEDHGTEAEEKAVEVVKGAISDYAG